MQHKQSIDGKQIKSFKDAMLYKVYINKLSVNNATIKYDTTKNLVHLEC